MNIKIIGTVANSECDLVSVSISHTMIEQLIQEEAQRLGIKPYKGQHWDHYSPTVIKVEIDD